jgi:hypothetical protein
MLASILLALIGAFYVFAGLVSARAGMTSRLLDQAISAITLERTSRVELVRMRINFATAALVFLGGALLLFQLDLALWVFLACAALQAAYLFGIAPRWLDPEDPPSASGRRQSINAFVIYIAATALVAWGAGTGKLTPIAQAPWWTIAAVAAASAGYVACLASGLSKVIKGDRSAVPPHDGA